MLLKLDDAFIGDIEDCIDKKLISKAPHNDNGLFILNYTHRCQFEQAWNDATITCRGLIVDKDYNRFSNPLPKFFNLSQHKPEDIPKEKFEAYEKLDGSLLISYFRDGKFGISTRGSFHSDQAELAMQIWKSKYEGVKLNENFTYMWELIHPKNRIVVDYGDVEDIVLLAVRKIETGEEVNINDLDLPFRKAKSYNFDNLEEIKKLDSKNEEGFVIKFDSGFRVRIKFDEYVRLHRIMTNVSNKSIHESLMRNDSLDELIENVPDEFYDFVIKTRDGLLQDFAKIESECRIIADVKIQELKDGKDRKLIASEISKLENPHVIFKMLDNRPYAEQIWRLIKPEYQRPFKIDEE